jgi:hypothetical protein
VTSDANERSAMAVGVGHCRESTQPATLWRMVLIHDVH